MGLFKKKQPADRWVHDLQAVADTDPEQFTQIREYDDSTRIVILQGGTEVWVTNGGGDVYFVVGLGSAGKMAEKFDMTVEEVYTELTQYMTVCSLGIDSDSNLRFATVLPGRDYTSEKMQDIMYRWTFQVMDFDSALENLIKAHGGDCIE